MASLGNLLWAAGKVVQRRETSRSVYDVRPAVQLVRDGLGARDIIDRVLSDLGASVIGRTEPRFWCPCGRDRAIRTLSLLGEDELRAAAKDGEMLEVRCEFCCEAYRLEPTELQHLLSRAGDGQ